MADPITPDEAAALAVSIAQDFARNLVEIRTRRADLLEGFFGERYAFIVSMSGTELLEIRSEPAPADDYQPMGYL